ncbi:hypothetical protein, partial [Heyndrickxia coagulans]|uniref:hypothetical protein n=1 Tax=Heyndrickxia coagulans TaxID=1398 RepID=UPI001C65CB52
ILKLCAIVPPSLISFVNMYQQPQMQHTVPHHCNRSYSRKSVRQGASNYHLIVKQPEGKIFISHDTNLP